MPRRVQDIIPSDRRSIRDIPVRNATVIHEIKKEIPSDISRTIKTEKQPEKIERRPRQRKKSRLPWLLSILGIVVIVAGIAFGISGHFATATFNLVPRAISINVNGTYIIPSLSVASSTSSNQFGYEVVSLSGTSSTTVPATKGSHVETKAQGVITIYNSYSSQSQKIVAGTRFVNNSGLVYRLTSSIIVPGYKTSGITSIPGSINASIIADSAGPEYNISSSDNISDFKILAYKGTSKYSGFYGRLAGNISGGFSGTQIVVAPILLASTTVLLKNSLSSDLVHNISASIPVGYIMYPGIYSSSFDKPITTNIDAKSAKISITGNVYGIIFKKSNLARFLSPATSTNVFGSLGFMEPNLETLAVTFVNQNDFSIAKKTNLVARLNGSFKLVGAIPVNTLRQAFKGIPISKTGDILKKYVSVIDTAHSFAEINPPWVTTVPTDLSRIIINVKNP